ncbi:Arginase-like protein [Pleurostoma richardsiae]|uniref:Arginase-like protein n=1 Tax=Pleurostoma richardsiae TaxID=41990 RepID=A0AA38VU45_9PEZI|nr:Arginase-like protein [Pleurostoma richardsiae]
MASTATSGSLVYEPAHYERVHKYHWPAIQLNIWMLIMLVATCTIVGIFATFIQIQQQLLLPIPWYFPYYITVASLGIVFIVVMLWLIYQRRLLPAIVMIGGFVMFVLWLVGLIVVSVELWGPSGSVQSSCNLAVFNQNPKGQTLQTLAWMEQKNICQSWQAVFSMGLVGAIFFLWIMIMAYQVFADDG